MRARDLMQADPVTLAAGDTLDIADDIMRLGRIRHLPVVENGRLVGLLTHRDLLAAAVSSMLEFSRDAQQRWLARIPVRRIMTTSLQTIGPDSPVVDAVRIMLERKVGCLPVVEGDALLGLLTETDCLRCLERTLAAADR